MPLEQLQPFHTDMQNLRPQLVNPSTGTILSSMRVSRLIGFAASLVHFAVEDNKGGPGSR